jgi:hypothetical protein
MNPLSNENVIFEYKDINLILTTHRVRYQDESFGNAEIKSIMLEELSSCTLLRSTYIIFLLFAGICLLLGVLLSAVLAGTLWILIISFLLALGFVFAYFASRQQVLILASSGTTIRVNAEKINLEKAKMIIDQTEAAKNARYLIIKGL